MAPPPRPYLKKGTGTYPKIPYPVLQRAGLFQPPPETSPTRRRSALENRRSVPGPLPNPIRVTQVQAPSRGRPTVNRDGIKRPVETGILGEMSAVNDISDSSPNRSRSPPDRSVHFGSSADSRVRDEGVVRDFSPTHDDLPSGRPRTAGTTDSGFPPDQHEYSLTPDSSVSPHEVVGVDPDATLVSHSSSWARVPIPTPRQTVGRVEPRNDTTNEFERIERAVAGEQPHHGSSSTISSDSTLTRLLRTDILRIGSIAERESHRNFQNPRETRERNEARVAPTTAPHRPLDILQGISPMRSDESATLPSSIHPPSTSPRDPLPRPPPTRSSSVSEGSAIAREELLGPYRPLDDVANTQRRPSSDRFRDRPSQATRRQVEVVEDGDDGDDDVFTSGEGAEETLIIDRPPRGREREDVHSPPTVYRGSCTHGCCQREREITAQLRQQLAEALMHVDMAEGTGNHLRQRYNESFERRFEEVAEEVDGIVDEFTKNIETMKKEAVEKEMQTADRIKALEEQIEKGKRETTRKAKEVEKNAKEKDEEYKKATDEASKKYTKLWESFKKKEKEKETLDKAHQELKKNHDDLQKRLDIANRRQATERGKEAVRIAHKRVEEGSARGRSNLSMGKENVAPSPRGILKPSTKVTFADDSRALLLSHLGEGWEVHDSGRSQCQLLPGGPFTSFDLLHHQSGRNCRRWRPSPCSCYIYEFDSGDCKYLQDTKINNLHVNYKRDVVEMKLMRYPAEVLFDSKSGKLEIYRPGREITVVNEDGTVEESILEDDGGEKKETYKMVDGKLMEMAGGRWRERPRQGTDILTRRDTLAPAVSYWRNGCWEWNEPGFRARLEADGFHVTIRDKMKTKMVWGRNGSCTISHLCNGQLQTCFSR